MQIKKYWFLAFLFVGLSTINYYCSFCIQRLFTHEEDQIELQDNETSNVQVHPPRSENPIISDNNVTNTTYTSNTYRGKHTKGKERRHKSQIVAEMSYLPSSFIIAGTQKGGTTALQKYFDQHPNLLSSTTETHYFENCCMEVTTTPANETVHPNHIRSMQLEYSKLLRQRIRSFNKKSTKIKKTNGLEYDPTQIQIFEKTPVYVAHPHVPKRIKTVVPDAKIIISLRDPLERAYSQYKMIMNGRTEETFEECIEKDLKLLQAANVLDEATDDNDDLDMRWAEYALSNLPRKPPFKSFEMKYEGTHPNESIRGHPTIERLQPSKLEHPTKSSPRDSKIQITKKDPDHRLLQEKDIINNGLTRNLRHDVESSVENQFSRTDPSEKYGEIIGRGLYYFQMKQFLKEYNTSELRQKMLIMKSESFNPDKSTKRINLKPLFDFIGVSDMEIIAEERIHATEDIGPMKTDTKLMLQKFYDPFNKKLASILGEEWENPWPYTDILNKE